MKWILIVLAVSGIFSAVAQDKKPTANSATTSGENANTIIPADMLTPAGKYWTIGTISSVNFYNTTPGAYYNTVRNGGGIVVYFKFKPGGKFENLVYVAANTYGSETETWTSLEGTVEFTTLQGHTVFITQATKGTYRIRKNGVETSRPIPSADLANQHSNTFIWEKWQNPDDNKRRYFLCINLDQYPQIKLDNLESTVKQEWVNKFHVED